MILKDFEGAEETGRQHITEEDIVCSEETDVFFTAALQLYKANGEQISGCRQEKLYVWKKEEKNCSSFL